MTIKHGRLLTDRPTLTGEGNETRPSYGAGKIYECDPTDVMRLKQFMAKEKRQVTETTETTPVDIQTLHERYMAGGSIKQIAAEANIPWQTLRAQFKQAGLSTRPPILRQKPGAADMPDVHGAADMPEEIPEGFGAKKRPYTPPTITEIPATQLDPDGGRHQTTPPAAYFAAFLDNVRALGGAVEEVSGVFDMRIRIKFGEVKHEQD